MHDFTRRTVLQGGTALAAAGALTGPALFDFAKAWAQSAPWKAEKGAKLTVMRWKRFVPAEDDAFNAMVAAFKAAVTNWTLGQAQILGAQGIRCNVVQPGPIFIEGGDWDRVKQGKPFERQVRLDRVIQATQARRIHEATVDHRPDIAEVMLETTLDEIDAAKAAMNCPNCNGQGCEF